MEEETISHLFYYCTHMQDIWNQVQVYFTDFLHLSRLTLQTAIFGFHNIGNDTFTQTTYKQYQKIWGFIFKQFSQ